jgi:hypothetical protein
MDFLPVRKDVPVARQIKNRDGCGRMAKRTTEQIEELYTRRQEYGPMVSKSICRIIAEFITCHWQSVD